MNLIKFITLVILCIFILNGVKSQDTLISKVEYFIDTDPGVGNGVTIFNGTPDDSISIQNFSINVNNLLPGHHFLYIRSKNSNGIWSVASQQSFYVKPALLDFTISKQEYFIDTDPGVGSGIPIPISSSDSILLSNHPISLAGLLPGIHHLYIRSKNSNGIWSVMAHRSFYIKTNDPILSMSKLEYFIDADPGVGNGIPISVTSGDSISLDDLDLAQNNLTLGNHHMCIRAKSNNGVWSVISMHKFKVCTTYGAVSYMDFHVEGNKVFFTNNSEYNDHTRWEFGDGTVDTFLHPIKIYNTAGNYNLKLISRNDCASDTLSTIISIHGLQKINATKSGNAGVATVFFEGNGFTNNTIIKLKKGNNEIFPVEKIFINPTRISAYFNLDGIDTGKYDVIGILGGGMLDTLKKGFTVEEARATFVRLIDNSGNRGRFNRVSPQFGLQNVGNEDAVMVPISFSFGYNQNFTNLSFENVSESFIDLSLLPFFQNTLSYFNSNNISMSNVSHIDIDTVRNRQLYSFCKVKVPTESFLTTSFKTENPAHHPSYNLGILSQPPMFSSNIVLNGNDSLDIRDCVNSFMKKAVRNNLNITINQDEWNECFNETYDSLRSTVKNLVRNFNLSKKSIPFKAIYSSFLVRLSQCPNSGIPGNLTNDQFSKIMKDFTYNWLYLENIDSIGRPCIDTTETFVFKAINPEDNSSNRIASNMAVPGCDGAAAEAFPELAEMCSMLTSPDDRFSETFMANDNLANKIGKKIFKKLIKAIAPKSPGGGVGGGLGLNSATAKCKDFCESSSFDPNEKFGPGNNVDKIFINNFNNYGYKITFENLETATANAAYVEIIDTLDKNVFDINTFQIGDIGWGDSIVRLEANRLNYSFLKDLRPDHPNYLRVDVRIDTLSGEANWKFFTLDTTSFQLTINPDEGFLPPNNANQEGEGFVTFSIKPKNGNTSGTQFFNSAKIIFDNNAPIITQTWQHIADTTKPESEVMDLPLNVNNKNFEIEWSTSDDHAGVEGVQTYVSINDSLYFKWNNFTTISSDTFFGKYGYTYKFFSIAKDRAGNFENYPEDFIPDAETTPLEDGQVISIINGLWHNPATWSNNQVPNINTNLIVKHNVNVEQNAVCKKATIVQPGHLFIAIGKRLDIDIN